MDDGSLYEGDAAQWYYEAANHVEEDIRVVAPVALRETRAHRHLPIVDLFSGSGQLSARLAHQRTVVEIDWSTSMLQLSRNDARIRADVRQVPLRSHCTGFVTAMAASISILNSDDRVACFNEVSRLLVPTGWFAVSALTFPLHDVDSTFETSSYSVRAGGGDTLTLRDTFDMDLGVRRCSVAPTAIGAEQDACVVSTTHLLSAADLDREALSGGLHLVRRLERPIVHPVAGSFLMISLYRGLL